MAFEIPPQPGYIYDAERRRTLVFDGISKIQHNLSLKIEDDPSSIKKGTTYVNNAQNEPDEVSFDIVMSNVYTTVNDLVGTADDRGRAAYAQLLALKKERRKVQVVTYLCTYHNMLLKSIAITQDDTCPNGWIGTLTFREAVELKGGGGSATASSGLVSTGASEGRTPSIWVYWLGANAI